MVGIVAIGMTARDAEDPLADQVRERVPIGRLEQDGAAVGTRVFLVERGDEGLVEQIREQNTCEASRRGLRCG